MRKRWLAACAAACLITASGSVTVQAGDTPSPAASVMRMLQSGRVPPERAGTLVELVCRRGTEEDLAYLFEQTTKPDGYTGKLRLETLNTLAETMRTRELKPSGSLEGLSKLLAPEDKSVDLRTRLAALELVGLWQVTSLTGTLEELALAPETPR